VHPQFYFNNLGVTHLRLGKYNMAIFYFSKALKFVEKSQSGQANQPFDKENPNEYISNLSTQKTSEILYNYGLALYKVQRYEDAYRCFEKASNLLKHNPKVSDPYYILVIYLIALVLYGTELPIFQPIKAAGARPEEPPVRHLPQNGQLRLAQLHQILPLPDVQALHSGRVGRPAGAAECCSGRLRAAPAGQAQTATGGAGKGDSDQPQLKIVQSPAEETRKTVATAVVPD
jgi:tetratricopeptide (TPR) repeat protein